MARPEILAILTDEVIDQLVNSDFSCGEATNHALRDTKTWTDLRAYLENREWFQQNYHNINEIYTGKMVGVLNQQVWFSSRDPEEFRKQLRAESRLVQIYVRYLSRKNENELTF